MVARGTWAVGAAPATVAIVLADNNNSGKRQGQTTAVETGAAVGTDNNQPKNIVLPPVLPPQSSVFQVENLRGEDSTLPGGHHHQHQPTTR